LGINLAPLLGDRNPVESACVGGLADREECPAHDDGFAASVCVCCLAGLSWDVLVNRCTGKIGEEQRK